MKRTAIDMTRGDPLGLLVRFSLPALAGSILHQVYSITDSIIVGRYLGQTALAAVGCTAPVVMLLAALMIGVNTGVGILLSQSYGTKNMADMRRTFANSLYFGAVIALAIGLLGLVFAVPILRAMGTPEGPLREASAYLRINFLTTGCPLLYFLFSGAFRSMGDSRTVLSCLVVSVLANVGLDLLFVAVFRWGVAGSAWATALAQAASALFAAAALWRKYPDMIFKREDLRLDLPLLGRVTRLALPIAVQSAFNNLGNIAAQSAVNQFGEVAMAAYAAAGRIGTLSLMPVETVGSSLAVFTGQNHGAHQPGRIRKGVGAAIQMVWALSIPLAVILVLASRSMIHLFLPDPAADVEFAAQRYILLAAAPGALAGMMQVFQQMLRGVGKASKAMWGGLFQLGAKIVVTALGAWVFHSLDVVWLAWPVSFVAGTLLPFWEYRKYCRQAQTEAEKCSGEKAAI